MNGLRCANRRAVLKTITAAAVGGGIATGTAVGNRRGPSGHARGQRNVVEVTAEHDHEAETHRFDLSRSEVESGWTTFEFDNQSEHAHFTFLAKLPQQALEDAEKAGMTPLEFVVDTLTKPFQYYMDTLVPDKEPDPNDLSGIYDSFFPPWFPEVSFHGGVGLTAGHTSSTTTLDLDPGVYTMECYVKNENNDFHSYLGMIEQIDVTSDDSGAPEPESTLDVSLSTGGIEVGDGLRPGRHTIGVRFEDDQKEYDNTQGHDLHLIRLDGGTTADEVNGWMDWRDPTQLIAAGDEPATFIGGVQEITAGLPQTAYFDVRLEPGDYAFVAEVPEPDSEGLLQEFTVPHRRERGE
jgi:hypothetical protein